MWDMLFLRNHLAVKVRRVFALLCCGWKCLCVVCFPMNPISYFTSAGSLNHSFLCGCQIVFSSVVWKCKQKQSNSFHLRWCNSWMPLVGVIDREDDSDVNRNRFKPSLKLSTGDLLSGARRIDQIATHQPASAPSMPKFRRVCVSLPANSVNFHFQKMHVLFREQGRGTAVEVQLTGHIWGSILPLRRVSLNVCFVFCKICTKVLSCVWQLVTI